MQNIGRYQLSEKLGHGGMGVVYRAFDTLLQRVVAIKVISAHVNENPEMRERFFREARAAGQLSHPNIVTIHDLGEHEGHPFLAMECLEGEDLQQRLSGPVPMSLHRKLDLAIDICGALEYAHAHGVVHRDIKPANIFITSAGQVKILDFGLARLMTSQMTQSNMLMGTLNYMAPEQVRGERADHRADVFSAGVVIYELLGGRKAFEGDSFASTLYKILQELPEPLWKIDATLPRAVVTAVDRALAKPLDERYQSMGAFREDLQHCLRQLDAIDTAATISAREVDARWRSDSHPGARAIPPISPLPGSLPPGTVRPATASAPSSGSAPAAPASKRPLFIGVALVAAGLVGVALWLGTRERTQAVVPPAQTSATRQQPAPAAPPELAKAQHALESHDYPLAERTAEQVLSQVPGNADAQRIRDRARTATASIEAGLRKAKASYASGDYQGASRAAGEVLTLAPANAEAKQIMEQGATRSRGAAATDARNRMTEARTDARSADAANFAPAAFRTAARAEQDARRLYEAGRMAEATARYYEASGLYQSAAVSANAQRAAAKERAESAPAAPPAVPAPAQAPAPAPAAGEVPKPAEPPPAPPPADRPPLPTIPVAKATPSVPVGELPPTSPSADDAIGQLLGQYKNALESRSFDAVKRLWPGLSGPPADAIRNEFQHASRISVDILDPRISAKDSSGTVTFRRRYELVTVDGQRLRSETPATMEVRKTAGGWVIDSLRFSPGR